MNDLARFLTQYNDFYAAHVYILKGLSYRSDIRVSPSPAESNVIIQDYYLCHISAALKRNSSTLELARRVKALFTDHPLFLQLTVPNATKFFHFLPFWKQKLWSRWYASSQLSTTTLHGELNGDWTKNACWLLAMSSVLSLVNDKVVSAVQRSQLISWLVPSLSSTVSLMTSVSQTSWERSVAEEVAGAMIQTLHVWMATGVQDFVTYRAVLIPLLIEVSFLCVTILFLWL